MLLVDVALTAIQVGPKYRNAIWSGDNGKKLLLYDISVIELNTRLRFLWSLKFDGLAPDNLYGK